MIEVKLNTIERYPMVIEVSDWDKASLKRNKEIPTQQTKKTT
jgi:hypothetical protein